MVKIFVVFDKDFKVWLNPKAMLAAEPKSKQTKDNSHTDERIHMKTTTLFLNNEKEK